MFFGATSDKRVSQPLDILAAVIIGGGADFNFVVIGCGTRHDEIELRNFNLDSTINMARYRDQKSLAKLISNFSNHLEGFSQHKLISLHPLKEAARPTAATPAHTPE